METCLTPAEIRTARELRIHGKNWREIGDAVKRSSETVRRAIDPDFREFRQRQVNAARDRRTGKEPRPARYIQSLGNHVVTSMREIAPPEVLAERDRRSELPRTIGMLLLGDPLPGRSALERAPDPKPLRRGEALDALIYRHH